jgi:dipeptidyl aminopeptidase/acylaminoacyl peptidase
MTYRFANRTAAALLAATLAGGALAQPAKADLPPLIGRAVLFGNPVKTLPTLSPDGKKFAYLAPSNGVLAVWVRTIGASDDKVVASDPTRPIRNVSWQPDSKHILYAQDNAGDENFHIFQTDVATLKTRDLTPYPKVRAGINDIDPRFRNVMLVEMNKRDPKYLDVWRIDLTTGATTLDTKNPGNVQGWIADNKMRIRAALAANPDGSSDLLVRDGVESPWRTLKHFSADDGFPSPQAFSPDNNSIYVTTAAGANAARLVSYDVTSGATNVIYEDPTYDVGGVTIDPVKRNLVAVGVERDRSEWVVFDQSYKADFDAIAKLHPGDFSLTSSNLDGSRIIVLYTVDNGSPAFYAYDRKTKKGTFLFVTRPELERYTLATMQPIAYKAGDGLTIHGYLTLPPGVAPKNLPMVVLVHGGPWGRDGWGYNGYVQWLANRGYAVLQPNFRGSTGFGKAFLNAGDRQWAGAMHQDLIDAKNWAVAQGIADPKKVAIMGGSYGGYATLAAVTFSPDAFTAGVDIVGPSNLNTLLASIPPYWETLRATFAKRMGDTKEFLDSQSPLFKADRIKVPLLIGQGANDPRVNRRESDQIVAAMRKNNEPVEYIVFPDEGHGFARPENNRRFNAATEAFLSKYLGGRAEPASADESVTAFEH